jgi:hypothetical protein
LASAKNLYQPNDGIDVNVAVEPEGLELKLHELDDTDAVSPTFITDKYTYVWFATVDNPEVTHESGANTDVVANIYGVTFCTKILGFGAANITVAVRTKTIKLVINFFII